MKHLYQLLTNRRELLILLALLLFLAGASLSPDLYDLAVGTAFCVVAAYAAQNAVEMLGGACRGVLGFIAGVGGVVYLCGLALMLLQLAPLNGRDLPFLVRLVGAAFMVLPLVLHRLPVRVQRSLGVEGC